ncbi:MAG: hypothetical protein KatS3mg061_1517 [Dehalococcoidia bacterium]|nr:MAG: hypothetical protein KatS3mg061_1517 [Dehalococcoidia bacterium]
MNGAAPVIEARDLWRIYRQGAITVPALRGVSLTIRAGEMVAIMGPSGCGKTTLLNCLAGLDEPDTGEVWIEGVPLRALSDDQRTLHRARRMGFVFQTHNLLPVLSALENVELPMLLAGMSAREARQRARGGAGSGAARRPARPPTGPTLWGAAAARGDRPRHCHRARDRLGG